VQKKTVFARKRSMPPNLAVLLFLVLLQSIGYLKLSLSGILVSPMLIQKCCSVGMVVHEQGPKSVAEGVGLLEEIVAEQVACEQHLQH